MQSLDPAFRPPTCQAVARPVHQPNDQINTRRGFDASHARQCHACGGFQQPVQTLIRYRCLFRVDTTYLEAWSPRKSSPKLHHSAGDFIAYARTAPVVVCLRTSGWVVVVICTGVVVGVFSTVAASGSRGSCGHSGCLATSETR